MARRAPFRATGAFACRTGLLASNQVLGSQALAAHCQASLAGIYEGLWRSLDPEIEASGPDASRSPQVGGFNSHASGDPLPLLLRQSQLSDRNGLRCC